MNSYIFVITCSMFFTASMFYFLTTLMELEQHLISYFASEVLAEVEPRQPVDSKNIAKTKADIDKGRFKRETILVDYDYRFNPFRTTPQPIVIRKVDLITVDIQTAFDALIKFPRSKLILPEGTIYSKIALVSYLYIITKVCIGILGILFGLVTFYYLLRWYKRQNGLPPEPVMIDYMAIYQIQRENVADQEQVNIENDVVEEIARADLEENDVVEDIARADLEENDVVEDIARADLDENDDDDRQADNVGVDQYI